MAITKGVPVEEVAASGELTRFNRLTNVLTQRVEVTDAAVSNGLTYVLNNRVVVQAADIAANVCCNKKYYFWGFVLVCSFKLESSWKKVY